MKISYELTLIQRISLNTDEEKKLMDSVKELLSEGGKILQVKDMGKRMLSYPIKKEKEGNYKLLILEASGKEINSLSSKLNLDDRILRYLFVKIESSKTAAVKEKKE
ncbi:30S ribosomal protein S6 [Candidatus Gottesmanbacteria bacterium CG11_big_fil_rev_8_21_14_0_20_37_11]|uniref:Small ribosomal subunit protein bS6 n=1 Tax=Candidatus Gottesmanbacteria bacterium CG11_big_fil_rev_8_21_14_0_20_37_11 TaxID=1974575 RepID=A0A2H0NK61_9BACT|nr:MAG: 30S ribosomal protein S6 [Candidatus Gottesmanbacteria bacterium CG23_combo_of_CG06-09_8_20_14_all_37_19]PIR08616.1 MAG: 30S ribosomal protein S6 [Candidatus Gottesmanbacteria bacterium CG11_big_fil_rev_8_21_14_0_20_37_11]